jgi:ribosomal protein S18 acetylase RimI-like enzyme
MNLVTLAATPPEALARCFDRAFGDYAVAFAPAASFLPELVRRRGVRLELSVGVEEHGELVAFTLNAIGRWRGALTGYDSGTGVVPAFRGRRLTAAMLARTRALLREAGATSYLLEVLGDNVVAIRAYRGAGFTTTRELRCWELEALSRPADPGIAVIEEAAFDPAAMAPLRDSEPSWQNSDEAIARAGAPRVTLAVRDDLGLAGCAVLFPATCDLAQLAVARRARRRGLGRALLAAARARCARPLRIVNVDARDEGSNAFIAATGAADIARQLEMSCPLA